MNWESSTERSVRRAKPTCPICAKSPKRDYPSGAVCSLCGYAGEYPYAIPDTTEAVALEKSLLAEDAGPTAQPGRQRAHDLAARAVAHKRGRNAFMKKRTNELATHTPGCRCAHHIGK